MVKKIQINLGNKAFYLLTAVLVLVALAGIAIAYGGANPAIMGHSAGEILSCPSGFTPITKTVAGVERTLGCMQNIPSTSKVICPTAIQNCWTTYGGRLPSTSEEIIALTPSNGFGLTPIPSASYEWTDAGGSYCTSVYSTVVPGVEGSQSSSTTHYYRCFIPA